MNANAVLVKQLSNSWSLICLILFLRCHIIQCEVLEMVYHFLLCLGFCRILVLFQFLWCWLLVRKLLSILGRYTNLSFYIDDTLFCVYSFYALFLFCLMLFDLVRHSKGSRLFYALKVFLIVFICFFLLV